MTVGVTGTFYFVFLGTRVVSCVEKQPCALFVQSVTAPKNSHASLSLQNNSCFVVAIVFAMCYSDDPLV